MELIVALDVTSISQAESLVELLKEKVEIFKVGSRLFTAVGPDVIKMINRKEKKVFLDLKFCDIPSVVAAAVKSAAEHNVFALTVHILGGLAMLKEAVSVCPRPLLWGVTILTSLTETDLRSFGISRSIPKEVFHLARIAQKAGLDGVVCSPQEIAVVKKLGLKVITPGIRITGVNKDQKRTLTPQKARKLGADYIVVGREIIESKDPIKTVDEILCSE